MRPARARNEWGFPVLDGKVVGEEWSGSPKVGDEMEQARSFTGNHQGQRRAVVWIAVSVVALLFAAACGGDDDDAAATTTTAASGATTTAGAESTTTALEPVDPLKVTIGSVSEVYAGTWIALGDQLFEKHGVDVEVSTYDGVQSGLAQLTADQIDLFFFTPLLGLNLANQGIEISNIFRFADFTGYAAAFVTTPDITSFDDLKAKGSDCRIAATSVGTGYYYLALAYKEAYGLECEIVPQGSATLALPALTSGEVQAAVIVPALAYGAVEQNVVNILFDPRTATEAEAEKVVPEGHPFTLVFGKKEVLEKKREAVVRFVAALQEANKIVQESTPEELAEITLQVEPWKTTDPAKLAQTWKVTQQTVPPGPDSGRMSEADWNKALNGVVKWGVEGIDPADPDLAYDKVVDMSYYDEAGERQ